MGVYKKGLSSVPDYRLWLILEQSIAALALCEPPNHMVSSQLYRLGEG